jgi:Tol biopolymer transport system component
MAPARVSYRLLAWARRVESTPHCRLNTVVRKSILQSPKIAMVGKVLAQYQISEKLGEGGMGVVWKARDTHLDRFVALKTLSAERLADPERKRRFVQEAKAASALNHPNIVHIYDIAEADGVQFIAMEYVPGKTLDQLIGRKGLRLSEGLKYAIQITDALARAHAAGIVHRDLKPSNLMIDDHGLVKVLDFGLAKLAETSTGEFGETATVRAPEGPTTEEGTIVGTTAYMSPEQAEGKKVDARSDIFSFGSVLYEMVTGRRAFHGDSKLSTLSAILKEDPKPVNSLVPDVPRDLEKIISHCLRKDPGRRFQHMDDLRVALLDLKEESESGKSPGITDLPKATTTGKRRLAFGVGVMSLFLIAASGLWLRFIRPAPSPRAEPRVVPLTSYPGAQYDPALSPDGKQVAFSWMKENDGNSNIYVKLIDAGSPLKLTSPTAEDRLPAWSPDARHIAFCRVSGDGCEIFVVPALGGSERKLGQVSGSDLVGISWSPDGKFLAVIDRNSGQEAERVFLMSVETGAKRQLTSPPSGYAGDCCPTFSPDGRTLAFARWPSIVSSDIYVLSVGADGAPIGQPHRLTADNRIIGGLDWTADGRNIIFSSDRSGSTSIWTVLASGGKPERLGVAGENVAGISVSRTGNRLAYQRWMFDSNVWQIPGPNSTDKKVLPKKLIASTEVETEAQFSSNGKKIVFTSNRSGSTEIWACDGDGSNPVQMTFFGGPNVGTPRWSPDGRQIAFDSTKEGNNHTFVLNVEGGLVRRLTTETSNDVRPSWSRDGRWIYFGSDRTGDSQVWKAPREGGPAVQVTKRGGTEAFESTDGKFVYYAQYHTPGIWRVPVEGGEETQVLDQSGMGRWALADQGICFLDFRAPPIPVIKMYGFASGRVSMIRQFPKGTPLDYVSESAIAVSPDGRWIIYTQLDQTGSNLMLVENYR